MLYLKNLIFRWNSLFLIFILFVGIIIGSIWEQPYKYVIKNIYQDEYQKHVYRCDSAMRNHFIAKSKVNSDLENISTVSENTLINLEQSEIALIDCHDYDLFRKKLLSFGLTVTDLSYMGLLAIEAKGSDIEKLVRIHEIRY